MWLLPSQLRRPIRISLALHFDKKTNCIVLDRCDLDSSSKSGFLVKGAIKLFGGKLEEFIARYFPITLSPLIDKAILALSVMPLPYKVGIDHPQIKDLRLVENKIWISFHGRLALSSGNPLSQEEKRT